MKQNIERNILIIWFIGMNAIHFGIPVIYYFVGADNMNEEHTKYNQMTFGYIVISMIVMVKIILHKNDKSESEIIVNVTDQCPGYESVV